MNRLAVIVTIASAIATPAAATKAPNMIKPTCWEENRGGQVYLHCSPETTPSPHRGPPPPAPVTKDEPPIAPAPPVAGPPPAYGPPQRPWRPPSFAPGPPPPQCYTAWGWQPCAAAIPLGPPVYVEPPPFFEPPVYVEPLPYAEGPPPPPVYIEPLPCTPKLSPYGGLGDGPFCQIVGDPYAW